ncbi:hypothetical protein GCK32_009726 [Trichostrongylus colubriformis]|uniref:Cytoplasmic tRNA 2-thiolation protein 2 n=1 Tax=Trichostrongylus colubriformis TaxID=6319 RepID=A0AAN8IL53_TRICO
MEGRRNHSDDSSTCNGETSNSVKCVKCPEEANLKSNNTSYCEKCFLTMVKGKFRSALSKRKIFRDKDSRKALVVLDGSRESAFLFRQIEDSVKQTNFKRLMIEPSFLLLLSSLDTSEISMVEAKLSVLKQALPCTYFVVHLAAVFGDLQIGDNGGVIGLQHTPFTSHYVYEARCKGSLQQCTSKFLGKLLDDGFKGTVPNILGAVGKIHIRNGGRLCSLCEYSFCGEGMLCYACSNIAKDLPSSVVNDLPFQIGCPSE